MTYRPGKHTGHVLNKYLQNLSYGRLKSYTKITTNRMLPIVEWECKLHNTKNCTTVGIVRGIVVIIRTQYEISSIFKSYETFFKYPTVIVD